jgi:hypothetical protein
LPIDERFFMAPRWIAFDSTTALELKSRMPGSAVFEAPAREPVEYALDKGTEVVVVLPMDSEGRPAVAVFRPGRKQATPPEKPLRTRPSGILGLSEALELEEGPPEKTNWWRRLF